MRGARALRRALRAVRTVEQRAPAPCALAGTRLSGAATTSLYHPYWAVDLSAWRGTLCAGAWPSLRCYSSHFHEETGPTRHFRLAQTGEGIKEVELLKWFVAEGDAVEAFQQLAEVQSDKATIELTSPYTGVVQRLCHSPGDTIQVGDVLAEFRVEGREDAVAAPAAHSAAPEPAAAAAAAPVAEAASSSGTAGGSQRGGTVHVLTSPAVRRLAAEHGVDLSLVAGTGPGGRVTRADVDAFLAAGHGAPPLPARPAHAVAALAAMAAGSAAGAVAAAGGAPAGELGTTVVPLRGYRRAMVKSMAAAATIPHFHFCEEVQMDALVELRERLRSDPSLRGAKLTYMPFFIKAAALALADWPGLNASLAPDATALLQHGRVNIGVAMATPHGLAVPNIKDCQVRSIAEIAAELARLQAAAASNALAPGDVAGGTFTLSNVGTLGGVYATPLVNFPEVAIAALGRVRREPRMLPNGSAGPVWVMGLSLGADHRAVDGASLAGFAASLRRLLEEPGSMLLHLR